MIAVRLIFAALMILIGGLVVLNLPYPALSPRWFFTVCGVMFMCAAFVGFVMPEKRKRD